MRLMYMDNPEDYLQTTGHLIKPLTPKSGKSEKSIDTKTKEYDMKVQDVKLMNEIEEKQWKCCSFDLHPQSSLFFGKLLISCMVIILCSFQLITLRDCNYQSLYSSLLSSVITYWLSKR